jgi:hypothetical protein
VTINPDAVTPAGRTIDSLPEALRLLAGDLSAAHETAADLAALDRTMGQVAALLDQVHTTVSLARGEAKRALTATYRKVA